LSLKRTREEWTVFGQVKQYVANNTDDGVERHTIYSKALRLGSGISVVAPSVT